MPDIESPPHRPPEIFSMGVPTRNSSVNLSVNLSSEDEVVQNNYKNDNSYQYKTMTNPTSE